MSTQTDETWRSMWMTHTLSGEQLSVLCPCIEIEFYLEETNRGAVLDLYERTMALIGPELTHYQAEHMKRPAALTARARTMVPTWLRKPKRVHFYWMSMYGGNDLGVHPSSFGMTYWDEPVGGFSAERRVDYLRTTIRQGAALSILPSSRIRLTVPVDHRFADAKQLIAWLGELALLKEGPLLTGHAGYALNAENFIGVAKRPREALCLRHPGLAHSADGGRLSSLSLGARPGVEHIVPLIRRAAWITIVHKDSLGLLGGEAGLRAAFADTPEIQLHPVPQGLIVQAGPKPQLGDLARGDSLPVLRKVAKVLRPIRAERVNEPEDTYWDTWFDLLDKQPESL